MPPRQPCLVDRLPLRALWRRLVQPHQRDLSPREVRRYRVYRPLQWVLQCLPGPGTPVTTTVK
ncbi:MAG: hypothetical protein Q8P59_08070, partial [Dehalococcoidia bacterium]|nr:hypothetical protein [Dehalococcoidia bacterium]